MNKKTSFIYSLVMVMVVSLLAFENTKIKAEEEQNDTLDINLHNVKEYAGEISAEGFLDWQPEGNPYAREMYGGYHRNGNFYVVNTSNKQVYTATSLKVEWKPGGGVKDLYYVPSINQYIEESGSWSTREYINATGKFMLNKNCNVWQYPIFNNKFLTKEVLPKGTYEVVKEAMEFVQLKKSDGKLVWVVPQYYDNDVFIANKQGYFVDSKETLKVTNVNGKPIKQWLMPIREDKRTGIAMQPRYVTIHNTGSPGIGANAYVHAKNQIHDNRTWVSWHYTVDNNEIYQSIPMNEVAYHAGDGQNLGNGATIGIEICENADGNYAQAEKNAAYLTAQILYENGMPSDAVRMHKDWSGKQCAKNILEGTKGTMGWNNFKSLVKQEYDKLKKADQIVDVDQVLPTEFSPFLKELGLQFDEGIVTGFQLGGTISGFIKAIENLDENVQVTVMKNNVVANQNNKIATGQIVKLMLGDKAFSFAIVISGDVNGDGEVLATDYVLIKNQIMGKTDLQFAYLKAADANKDNNIFATDYVKVKNYIMGKGSI